MQRLIYVIFSGYLKYGIKYRWDEEVMKVRLRLSTYSAFIKGWMRPFYGSMGDTETVLLIFLKKGFIK